MVQVAQLEEQGRLVEASELLASQLGAPPPQQPEASQHAPQAQPQIQPPASSHSSLPPPPVTNDAWPEPPGQAPEGLVQAREKLAPDSELAAEMNELEL